MLGFLRAVQGFEQALSVVGIFLSVTRFAFSHLVMRPEVYDVVDQLAKDLVLDAGCRISLFVMLEAMMGLGFAETYLIQS